MNEKTRLADKAKRVFVMKVVSILFEDLMTEHDKFVSDNGNQRKSRRNNPFGTVEPSRRENIVYAGNGDYDKLKHEACNKRYEHHRVLVLEYVDERTLQIAHAEHVEKLGKGKGGERHRLRLVKDFRIRVK